MSELSTQSPVITQPTTQSVISKSPETVSNIAFSHETIKTLTSADFNIDNKELVTIKHLDCMLVMFYVENTESKQLATIWASVAQQIAGPVFAAINMLTERKVAEAFTKLKTDGSNPLHWAGIRQFPFIMIYRNGWPVAVYNGAREVQAIIDYSLTLACQAGYYEIDQVGGSMQAENRLEMGPYDAYRNVSGSPPKIRTQSLQYNSENPIRGFNPAIPVVTPGSPEATKFTQELQSATTSKLQKEALGVTSSTTPNVVPPSSTVSNLPGNILIPAQKSTI